MRIHRETSAETADRLWRRVRCDGTLAGDLVYYVEGRDRIVTMHLNGKATKKGWGCTCTHGSSVGINNQFELCRDILTVKRAIKERGALQWKTK